MQDNLLKDLTKPPKDCIIVLPINFRKGFFENKKRRDRKIGIIG